VARSGNDDGGPERQGRAAYSDPWHVPMVEGVGGRSEGKPGRCRSRVCARAIAASNLCGDSDGRREHSIELVHCPF
jgi:hypothetical protein